MNLDTMNEGSGIGIRCCKLIFPDMKCPHNGEFACEDVCSHTVALVCDVILCLVFPTETKPHHHHHQDTNKFA